MKSESSVIRVRLSLIILRLQSDVYNFAADTNRTRIVKKAKKTDSFFDFFSPPTPPTPEAVESGEIDEDKLDELEFRLEVDYQIGEDLKERVCSTSTVIRFRLADMGQRMRRSSPVRSTTLRARPWNSRMKTTTRWTLTKRVRMKTM